MLNELCASNWNWIVSKCIIVLFGLTEKNILQNSGRPLVKIWVCCFCGVTSNYQQSESWEMKALKFYQVNYMLAKQSQGRLWNLTLLLCFWAYSGFQLMKTKRRIFLGKFPKAHASRGFAIIKPQSDNMFSFSIYNFPQSASVRVD